MVRPRRASVLLVSVALLGFGCTYGEGECSAEQPCGPGGVCLGRWCVHAPDGGPDEQPPVCRGDGDAGPMVAGTPCVPDGIDPAEVVFEGTRCVRGTWTCDERGVPACRGFIGPGIELCDGVDDDCDGLADVDDRDVRFPASTGGVGHPPAGASCFTGPPGARLAEDESELVSRCRRGTWMCSADGPVCEGQLLPIAEDDRAMARAGVDDDCDGEVDEGAPDFELCDGVDNDHDGLVDEGRWSDELCDGVDNDCDGLVDEGFGWSDGAGVRFALGQRCVLGIGPCVALGSVTCAEDGERATCDATPGQPAVEVCNGIDDDCDGQTDNVDRVGEPCTVGVGHCAATGQYFCDRGGLACDAMPGEPVSEACNGVDDDCDGQTDEDFPVGGACRAGVGACAADGAFACAADGGFRCDAVVREPFGERCNNIDDDCDGEVDNLVMGECLCLIGQMQDCYGGPPTTLDVGLCIAGRQICAELGDGSAAFGPCLDEVRPEAERCNARDDDCDGSTDEACD